MSKHTSTCTDTHKCSRHITINLDAFSVKKPQAPTKRVYDHAVWTRASFLPSQTTPRMTLTHACTCVVFVGHPRTWHPGSKARVFQSLTPPARSPQSVICFCTVCRVSICPRGSEPSHEAPPRPQGFWPFPHQPAQDFPCQVISPWSGLSHGFFSPG